MNKKGNSVAIVILVIMALVLVVAATFSFLTNSRQIELFVSDTRVIDNVYYEEEQILNYMNQLGLEVISILKFAVTEESFSDEIEIKVGLYDSDDLGFTKLKEAIGIGKFKVGVKDGKVIFELTDFPFRYESKVDGENILSVTYRPEMKVIFDLA